MKTLKISLFVACCFISATSFAQSAKAIEADLLRSFKKLEYWDDKQRKGVDGASDSLETANDVFDSKIKGYAIKYPSTIAEPFTSLKKAHLDIFTSDDGLFRIYSWETWMGGTMRDFSNLMQYKNGQVTKATLLTSNQDNYIPFYSNLYTFKTGGKTYYLGIYNTIYSTKDVGTGIRIFSIENGNLNSDTKIIKTQSGLKSKIYYSYDFFSVVDIAFELRPTITFDAATKTIKIPLIGSEGKVTTKFITYKFNGQYFEKMKS
ncbi:hypothetical protein IDJ75_19530 [Mucilaginibacter rigui]|uniref:Uncharacterized protein n=1 Tax=Mucilaginibacter rigui TaxID=534635 RepID=A0ABR7XBH1_9SPHI|nr:hypothetical protein [Mucilaginibacter rigui]MBD1387485.1 hypothetical protein [Mucilaginibacter rigui]